MLKILGSVFYGISDVHLVTGLVAREFNPLVLFTDGVDRNCCQKTEDLAMFHWDC